MKQNNKEYKNVKFRITEVITVSKTVILPVENDSTNTRYYYNGRNMNSMWNATRTLRNKIKNGEIDWKSADTKIERHADIPSAAGFAGGDGSAMFITDDCDNDLLNEFYDQIEQETKVL
tara:strand:- start:309 stop:665 length:357 start_codon:yes stop_codon:yes gene_type:complete